MINRKDLLSAFCLFTLGLFAAIQTLSLSIWGKEGPGPGFFPIIVSILTMVMSVLVFIKSLIPGQAKNREKKSDPQEESGGEKFKISLYSLLIILYGISIRRIGFLITSVFFLIITLKYIERWGWAITVIVSLVSVIISYVLFVYFLSVPLPKGLIRWF